MAKTTAEQIKKRLLESNDTDYYESKWAEAQAMLSNKDCGNSGGDYTFKSYPDISTRIKEIGKSNRILNACILQRAQVMRSLVEPTFPQVDKRTGEIRKQFWLTRAKGTGYADGDWLNELAAAFMDALPFGSGYVKFGPKTNPKTGLQYTDMMHVPILQMIFDRGQKTLARARYACDLTYLPFDIAEDRFGLKEVENYRLKMDSVGAEYGYDCVRMFEYWDEGFGLQGNPTRTIILGDIDQDPIEGIDDNYLGCLPYAHMDYLRVNNSRRAIGLCNLAAANQEDINQQEKKRRQVAKDVSFAIYDQESLVADDMERVNAGETGVKVGYTGAAPLQQRAPFLRVPGGEMAQADQWNWEAAMEEFRTITGTSELDNGSSVTGAETLGETQLVDQRSKKKAGLMLTQTALFLQRAVEKGLHVGKIVDNDPIILDVFGTNIPLNVPEEPNSAIALWLEEKSNVLIGEEALMKGDEATERAMRRETLSWYATNPVIATQAVEWLTEEMLKAGGDDPKEVMRMMQAAPMLPPGQPVQGQPAA